MFIDLYEHQINAIKKMHNGCILCGDVGTGKSRTALGYYYKEQGGDFTSDILIKPVKYEKLYIITTARKRDTLDWELEAAPFMIPDITVDSWNNIKKYIEVENSFFIFDEQRVVGKGAWVKAFLKITKHNKWILLSATPGDTWSDYAPVFIANGYFKNFTDFSRRCCVYSRFSKYPKIEKYIETDYLTSCRNKIMVNMPFIRKTVRHYNYIITDYDRTRYKNLMKTHINDENGEPFTSASELCYALRKVCNSNPSRIDAIIDILKDKKKIIVYYNFNYELDILISTMEKLGISYAQWNGHKHEPIPSDDIWAYLVQYSAGAEGWNCTRTDTIIFYSQNYSYKIMAQACGRIDRLNTSFKDLYYYQLKSNSSIDLAINRALKDKKTFNENIWIGK